MRDPRHEKFAQVLVRYCLDIQKGDLFRIAAPALAEPLVREVYTEALRAGAHPFVRTILPGLEEVFYGSARKHQRVFVNPIHEFEMETIDKTLTIRAFANTRSMTNTDPKKQAEARGAQRSIFKKFLERSSAGELLWTVTQFPCNASAQDAEMSLGEYEDFVFRSCMLNKKNPVSAWRGIHRRQARLCKVLDERKTLRIVREGTDVSMRIEGRKWINSDGKTNMPSGEVFTAPIEDSVEGTIAYSFPAIWNGREVHGIRLTFKKGKVVRATADKGEDVLHATLDTDEGARFVGEVAVGTNYNIKQFTKNILFDEKIGGTIHMAVGAAYPKTGGRNESSVHWDMITDMQDGGKIYADGKLIYKDGQFVVE